MSTGTSSCGKVTDSRVHEAGQRQSSAPDGSSASHIAGERRGGDTRQETCDDICGVLRQPFEPWAKATFGKSSPKTWLDFYRVGLRAVRNYRPLASLRLDEITSERAAEFAAYRQSQGLQVSTVNSSLRVLRRMLRAGCRVGRVAVSADDQAATRRAPSGTCCQLRRRGSLSCRCI